jgi:hypothetical protein
VPVETPASAAANEPDILTSRTTTVSALVSSPIADPGPLGLAGFAMTTVLLSLVNAKIIGGSALNAVLPLALLYGGAIQLLAGMWEFRNRNTFGALAFSSYGAFWISYYVFARWWLPTTSGGANDAAGFFLLMWGIFTLYMLIASFGTNVALVLVFTTLTAAFFLLAAGNLDASTGITQAGGVVGLICGILAWYTSFAGVTNATWKRTVLPVFPFSRAPGAAAHSASTGNGRAA